MLQTGFSHGRLDSAHSYMDNHPLVVLFSQVFLRVPENVKSIALTIHCEYRGQIHIFLTFIAKPIRYRRWKTQETNLDVKIDIANFILFTMTLKDLLRK